ncbi:PAX-interacting protein 1 [Cricetulus griseus]|nr:PAX-interacting protein 1 [Cricetulus griseus]
MSIYKSGFSTSRNFLTVVEVPLLSLWVGDLEQVIQLLKAGKAKEVSYNALASHIISEDGDNPEVGEAREVFDLPVVKALFSYLAKSIARDTDLHPPCLVQDRLLLLTLYLDFIGIKSGLSDSREQCWLKQGNGRDFLPECCTIQFGMYFADYNAASVVSS